MFDKFLNTPLHLEPWLAYKEKIRIFIEGSDSQKNVPPTYIDLAFGVSSRHLN